MICAGTRLGADDQAYAPANPPTFALLVIAGITAYVVGTLVKSIQDEKKTSMHGADGLVRAEKGHRANHPELMHHSRKPGVR